MIRVNNNLFELHTLNTSYLFRLTQTGHLEHLHYNKRIALDDNDDALWEKHAFVGGNQCSYDKDNLNISMDEMRLECSSTGKGDYREPFVEVVYPNGSRTSDFVFESYEILETNPAFKTLPGSYNEAKPEHLKIVLKEKYYDVKLILHYFVYEECDVITRSSEIINNMDEEIRVERLMSAMIDYDDKEFGITTFNGSWANEMNRHEVNISAGKFVNSSVNGTSSNRANPFVMLSRKRCNQGHGGCYGFNLIYSGNHAEIAEVSIREKLRFVSGINPQGFSYILSKGDCLEAPEAVMTYSSSGYNRLSHNMHDFVRNHIVRGKWKNKVRPVLLNSWEASYFNISEHSLLKLAKEGKNVGIEMFVMDDGWFGERNDDSSSLGDWDVNLKKLPGGIKGISEKINNLGLDFGLWVEPEMVNQKSNLYNEHPEWVMEIPGRDQSEGRNQRILDLCNPAVQEFLIEKMTEVFSSGNVSYVKWDMNRNFSDVYSKYLGKDNQGEVAHRYIIGLYNVIGELVSRFPDILFEGCASGGNRFDLGILCYFPQIWASDNTDALCRTKIQEGYSYGYPLSTISAHVSSHKNHQTLRDTPIESRFNVASFGVLGYECNLCDMSKEDLEAVKAQIEHYKKWRETILFGDFYRREENDNKITWSVTSKDKTKSMGIIFQKLVNPGQTSEKFKASGLAGDKLYHFYNRKMKINVKEFGELINTMAPIHVKQDSLLHNIIAKFVKLDGETEDYIVNGATLCSNGIHLKQGFGATGFSDEVRLYQDFGSRIYMMEEISESDAKAYKDKIREKKEEKIENRE
ncbi:MAG: alpha-galactosidase [Parasporobacterium sp.]|nr:alpha-galactosidase [Parasporobacterium sp.]